MTTKIKDPWDFEKVGMSYRLSAEEAGVTLQVGRLKRSGQELQGEILVKVNWDGIKTVDGNLHQARFNVSSVAARTTLIRYLKGRTDKTQYEEMDWADALENLCQRVMDAERVGEPLVSMNGTMPKRTTRYDVNPLCPSGVVTWLYGPGGKGKSLVGTAIAFSLAKGIEVIPGLAPGVTGPVLYCDYETDQWTVRERIEYIANGHQSKATKDFYYRRCYRPIADDVEDLTRIVADKGIKFVVVDSAGPAIGSHGEYGDANESTLKLFAALRLLGCTVLVIDHVSKQELMKNQKDEVVGAMPYGSVYKINLARSAWELRNGEAIADDDLHIRLINTKANDARLHEPIDLRIIWDSSQGLIMFTEDEQYMPDALRDIPEDSMNKRDVKIAIIDFLSGKLDGATRRDIQIGIRHKSEGYVRKVLGNNPTDFEVVFGSQPPRYRLVRHGGLG